MAGYYTHLQPARPIRFSHWLLSTFHPLCAIRSGSRKLFPVRTNARLAPALLQGMPFRQSRVSCQGSWLWWSHAKLPRFRMSYVTMILSWSTSCGVPFSSLTFRNSPKTSLLPTCSRAWTEKGEVKLAKEKAAAEQKTAERKATIPADTAAEKKGKGHWFGTGGRRSWRSRLAKGGF